MLKKGASGDEVTMLQKKLTQLGYEVTVDGTFGDLTHWGVTNFQAMFGYSIDGVVGPGTQSLIDAQLGYGWSLKNEDAQAAAQRAQGLNKA